MYLFFIKEKIVLISGESGGHDKCLVDGSWMKELKEGKVESEKWKDKVEVA